MKRLDHAKPRRVGGIEWFAYRAGVCHTVYADQQDHMRVWRNALRQSGTYTATVLVGASHRTVGRQFRSCQGAMLAAIKAYKNTEKSK